MRRLFNQVLAGVLLVTTFACEQPNKEESREEFRERQNPAEQQQPEQVAKTTPTEAPITFEQQNNASGTAPSTTAGDKVIAVKDGDTIDLLRNGETIKVRLYGVDSPEKTQDYGQKAKDFTSQLVFGKQVLLIEHNKDRYGRTVGTIMLPDGRSLNEELVRNGYAWHYKEYSKDKNLGNLEADARRFKRGLWQDANPTAPWEFRKNKGTANEEEKAKRTTAPIPAGATKRTVYICNSSGATVYHLTRNCFNLKRCTAEILAVTEAAAIREYGKRVDKSCSKK